MALVIRWYDFICFVIVGVAFFGALVFLIRRRESAYKPAMLTAGSGGNMNENLVVIGRDSPQLWKSCWLGISPAWLLAIRFLFLAILCVVLAVDVRDYGASTFLYYTEWTFTLVIIYFTIATIVSARGCFAYYSKKPFTGNGEREELFQTDMEQSVTSYRFLAENENRNSAVTGMESHYAEARILGYLMQAVYQTCAGAVVFTDIVFWCVIVPFLQNVHLQLNLLMGCMHSLNAVTLLFDTSISNLPFPWFRLAYFVLWSCCYVIFQWVIHACGFSWWPYPFLVLSTPWAPLWYFCMAVIHIPCYGFSWLVVSAKNLILSKLFGGIS